MILLIGEVEEEVVQRLGQCRMSKNSITESRVLELAHHRDLDDRHDFASLEAQDGRTHDLFAPGIHVHRQRNPFRDWLSPPPIVQPVEAKKMVLRVQPSQMPRNHAQNLSRMPEVYVC